MGFRDVPAGLVSGGDLASAYTLTGLIEVGNAAGQRIVVDGTQDAIFFYDASNNLITSLAPSAGTDALGHSYPNGLAVGRGGMGQAILGYNASQGTGFIYFPGPLTTLSARALISSFLQGVGTARQEFIAISSGIDSTQNDAVYEAFYPSSQDGTALARIGRAYKDPTGTFHFWEYVGYQGVTISPGTIVAPVPGTGTARNNVAVADGWNAMTLNSPFSNGPAPFAPARYQANPTNGGRRVDLSGSVTPSVGTAAFVVVATLPSGYLPTYGQHFAVATKTAAGANTTVVLNITGAGQIELADTAAAGDVIFLDGVSFVTD